jgi:hypothetical protein
LKYGSIAFIASSAVAVRVIRGSGAPGPGRSASARTGSRLSQYGSGEQGRRGEWDD